MLEAPLNSALWNLGDAKRWHYQVAKPEGVGAGVSTQDEEYPEIRTARIKLGVNHVPQVQVLFLRGILCPRLEDEDPALRGVGQSFVMRSTRSGSTTRSTTSRY